MCCHSVALWYGGPEAVANAIGYAQFYSRAHNAVIRVYDAGRQRDRDARAHGRFQRMVKRRYNIKLTAKPRMVPKRLCAVHKQPLRSAGWTLRAHTGVSKFVREFRRFFPATYGPAGSIRQSYICSCDVASPRAAARAKYLQMSHKQKTGVQSLTRTGVACPEQANLCQR